MEKVCYVLWREQGAAVEPIRMWARDALPGLAGDATVRAGQVLVEAPEGAAVRVGGPRDGALLCGLVTIWLDNYQDRDSVDGAVAAAPLAGWHTYLVSESVPHDDPTVQRPAGQPAPGITLATIFDKKPGVSEAEFYRVWHEMHRLTTVQVHPVYYYNRNEVVRPLTPGAPSLRGIVYEPTRTVEDLLDPHVFYGSGGDDDALKANIDRVVRETTAFIDYPSMEVAAMDLYELGS